MHISLLQRRTDRQTPCWHHISWFKRTLTHLFCLFRPRGKCWEYMWNRQSQTCRIKDGHFKSFNRAHTASSYYLCDKQLSPGQEVSRPAGPQNNMQTFNSFMCFIIKGKKKQLQRQLRRHLTTLLLIERSAATPSSIRAGGESHSHCCVVDDS